MAGGQEHLAFKVRCVNCGDGAVYRWTVIKESAASDRKSCQKCKAPRKSTWAKDGVKRCSRCQVTKPVEQFYKSNVSRDGAYTRCIRCEEDYRLKSEYHITIDDFEEMLEKQNHRCAVCGIHATETRAKVLCVDHCHKNGLVRGLLCHSCNMAIGQLGDDPTVLLMAARYLNKALETANGL